MKLVGIVTKSVEHGSLSLVRGHRVELPKRTAEALEVSGILRIEHKESAKNSPKSAASTQSSASQAAQASPGTTVKKSKSGGKKKKRSKRKSKAASSAAE